MGAHMRQLIAIPTTFSPSKTTLTSPTKRRYSPSSYEDELDSENLDPSIFASPTKRSKNMDGTPAKVSKFVLTDALSPVKPASASITPTLAQKRKSSALSVSLPATTNATPIGHSRGSPKHKRVGLLSKRRTSSSPFRRVEPPSFMRSSGSGAGLPFSIDAALSGTISNYTPKSEPAVTPAAAEPISFATDSKPARILEDAMPKNWFFEIHEDTPEEEAANLMEHSALCLDISSDDDEETKRINLEKEKGKENVPPPDFLPSNSAASRSSNAILLAADATDLISEPIKSKRQRIEENDVMVEDRKALGDLLASDFYPEGLDASSIAVAADDHAEEYVKSGLSHEPLQAEPEESADATVAHQPEAAEPSEVAIWVDESAAAGATDNPVLSEV